MDEDQDEGDTPRKSGAQKRAIITSPSEKTARPARRQRQTNLDVSVQKCSDGLGLTIVRFRSYVGHVRGKVRHSA
jgi:hypothetical protein